MDIQKEESGAEAVMIVRANYWRFRTVLNDADFQRQQLEDDMRRPWFKSQISVEPEQICEGARVRLSFRQVLAVSTALRGASRQHIDLTSTRLLFKSQISVEPQTAKRRHHSSVVLWGSVSG